MQKQKGSLHKAAIQLLGEWCSFLFVGLLFDYYYLLVKAYLLSLTPVLGKGKKKKAGKQGGLELLFIAIFIRFSN